MQQGGNDVTHVTTSPFPSSGAISEGDVEVTSATTKRDLSTYLPHTNTNTNASETK